MPSRRDVAAAMRARARQVRQDGAYGGLFEIMVWCRLNRMHVLLAFGVSIMDVNRICGAGLRPFKPKVVHKMVACKMVNERAMSADKPGLVVPDVNHFVFAHSRKDGNGLTTPREDPIPYLPDGSRRNAVSSAADLQWVIYNTDTRGDCLIDCFSHYSKLPRT